MSGNLGQKNPGIYNHHHHSVPKQIQNSYLNSKKIQSHLQISDSLPHDWDLQIKRLHNYLYQIHQKKAAAVHQFDLLPKNPMHMMKISSQTSQQKAETFLKTFKINLKIKHFRSLHNHHHNFSSYIQLLNKDKVSIFLFNYPY